ncbi:hypothetical protein Tco_1568887 [Tanacetum coccineum]
MAQENYVEGFFMKRPPLLKADGLCFWKSRFEIYVKSKDIDLWQVIQNSDFYFEVEDSKTKMMKETPYELLKDEQKKQLGKNNKAKITLYNALSSKSRKKESSISTVKIESQVNVTREQTSDDSDSQGGSDEHIDEEEEAEAFNLMAKDFCKFFRKGNQFGHGNRFGNGANRFRRGRRNSFGKKVVKA